MAVLLSIVLSVSVSPLVALSNELSRVFTTLGASFESLALAALFTASRSSPALLAVCLALALISSALMVAIAASS